MPRTGMNPSRGRKTDYKPARVTLAVLTYLPDTVAYYENRFDVTRLCLESLIANTLEPYDLLVFDNGSSQPMVDYLRGLRDSGDIDYLMLSSQNVGKIGALQMITRFAPGEVIAYTDDDIFFLPGWLETHLKIIDTYPGLGMVTGFYIRPHMSYGNESALRFAEQSDVKVERGLLIPRGVGAAIYRQYGPHLGKIQRGDSRSSGCGAHLQRCGNTCFCRSSPVCGAPQGACWKHYRRVGPVT